MDNSVAKFFQRTIVVCFGAMFCSALWGSAFPCVKIGYELFQISSDQTGTQILFAGIRFFIAGILALIIGSIINKRILVPKKESWGKILKLSSLQTVAQYILFYIGLAHTIGVRASIVEGTNVFVAILIASLIFHQEDLTTKKVVGCLLGFAGVVLVNLTGGTNLAGDYLMGDVLVFLSTFAYAFSSVCLKKYSKDEDPIVLSGYQFVIGGLIMIVVGLVMGGKITLVTTEGLMMLAYLSFVSAAAYSLWGMLIKYNPISKVAVFGFMNPIFGFVLSIVLLNEGANIGIMCLASLVLVCLGIYIVNKEQ